ncbi:MAG: YfiR family protein, partial [Kangiellaceae bacterium]|nr:YfiR family protein [Kangiellaceae bacterium]
KLVNKLCQHLGLVGLLALLLLPMPKLNAQTTITVDKNNLSEINRIKAAYLFNFLKYVEFDDSSNSDDSKESFVCILGKDPFGRTIDAMQGKKAKNKTVNIRRLSSEQNISECNIIYISQSESSNLASILKGLENSSILTVSEIKSFTQQGGIVEFTKNKKKIGITINLKNAHQAKIRISALLLEIAKLTE